ncbi:UNVERIFIED_CONTAM: E3 ubiquitin-protein ligase WAV3 [Sesamum radiatum]|uniref:E3 ubiquitin-protein ligase WAV3 n=1 Tax=Sesamum radiatum TaxID=300843 RepID=A0AAW2SZM7_SESRA
MTDRGREDAKAAVNSLISDGGTDIVEGLKKGARVLEERRERNPVASIILLSDGKHTFDCILARRSHQNRTSSDLPHMLGLTSMLPPSLCPNSRESRNENNQHSFPVHAFGLGVDHDSSTMHAISDASGASLTVTSASPGVGIDSIPSGRYASEISDQGFQAVINVGDLYADEEKEFLVHLSIPECRIAESVGTVGRTSLLKIACSYRDTASKAMVQLEGEQVEIRRPKVVSQTDREVSLEVDRQRNRLWVAEGIAKAQEMAEMGNLEGAQAVLAQRRTTLLTSASAQAGDGLCSWLEAELMEIKERMENMAMYEHTGRAYVLSGLSSHSWQRATTRVTLVVLTQPDKVSLLA